MLYCPSTRESKIPICLVARGEACKTRGGWNSAMLRGCSSNIRQILPLVLDSRPKSYGKLASGCFRFRYSMCCIEPSLQFLIIIYHAAKRMVIV
jgi:hypothetical protein